MSGPSPLPANPALELGNTGGNPAASPVIVIRGQPGAAPLYRMNDPQPAGLGKICPGCDNIDPRNLAAPVQMIPLTNKLR